jgi:KUP system potassium uptake protein
VDNPFLALAPEGSARFALMALSICAAIIASQALISGAYSLIRQAIQLGYFPRLTIKHTNPDQAGQIYLPLVNISLALGRSPRFTVSSRVQPSLRLTASR